MVRRSMIMGVATAVATVAVAATGCSNPGLKSSSGGTSTTSKASSNSQQSPTSSRAAGGTTTTGSSATSSAGGSSSRPALPASCKASHPIVGVALPNTVNPYYVAMRKSFLDNGRKAGFNVKMAIADDSDSNQLKQIDAFIQQHVCAIALNAVDSGPGAAMAAAADRAGIPVFTVNVSLSSKDLKAQHATIVQYVGPDQVEGGRVMGEAALRDLGSKATIIAGIVGDPQQLPTNERDSGFKTALAKDPNAKSVATVNSLVKPDVALMVTTEMLQGHPTMNVIFADTGPGAVGAIQAIKQLGLSNKVKLYAFCAASTALTGFYRACSAQQPAQYAQIVVANMAKYLKGQSVPAQIHLPVAIFHSGQTPPPGELG